MTVAYTATRDSIHVQTCWMIRRDMPEVLAIEQASFENPWTEDEFLSVLRQRNSIGMVVKVSSIVVGYMIYQLHKRRLEILDLAVHPDWRRRGIGQLLIYKLKINLSSHRRSVLGLYTAETSLCSHFFWRAMGFRAISLVDGYYGGEAAIWFIYLHPEE